MYVAASRRKKSIPAKVLSSRTLALQSAVDDRSSILGLRRFLNQIFNGSITMPNLIIHVVSCLSCEFALII